MFHIFLAPLIYMAMNHSWLIAEHLVNLGLLRQHVLACRVSSLYVGKAYTVELLELRKDTSLLPLSRRILDHFRQHARFPSSTVSRHVPCSKARRSSSLWLAWARILSVHLSGPPVVPPRSRANRLRRRDGVRGMCSGSRVHRADFRCHLGSRSGVSVNARPSFLLIGALF